MDQTSITPASHANATLDRQNLARDIFQRLCVACGAKIYVDKTQFVLPQKAAVDYELRVVFPMPTPAQTWTVNPSEYDAIRYLAQLAANIVDYIDGDNINTPFVWNPIPSTMMAPLPSDNPFNVAEYAGNFDATNLPERVVFGVEKPRLVISETYAEVANAVADESTPSASTDFEVRIFAELLNAGNSEGVHSPLVGPDGTVPGSEPLVVPGGMASIPSYRLQVYDNGVLVRNELAARTPENVTGTISVAPRLQTNFVNAVQANAALRARVEPNNGAFTADLTPMTGGRNGFCVVGPQVAPVGGGSDPAYRPDPAGTGPTQFLVQIPLDAGNPLNQLMYTTPRREPGQIQTQTLDPLRTNGHAVVLQRLACPYLPESPTNPYVTVDAMSQVWVNDAIRVGRAPAGMGMTGDRAMNTPTAPNNHSMARMAPYAGIQPNTPPALNPTVAIMPGTALTIPQVIIPAPTATPHESFFRHNTQTPTPPPTFPVVDAGLIFPFSAPTQLDRRLVNVAELLHVATCRGYELTSQFAAPTLNMMTTTINQHLQELNRTLYATGTPTGMAADPQVPLYRMFEVLQTKPWNWGIPHGGRTAGAVNVNMLWDQDATTMRSKVFDAVLDPQVANRFAATDLTGMWTNLKESRTPNWTGTLSQQTIRATTEEADDTGAPGTDRPFRGFGTGVFTIPGANPHVREVGGMDSTLLRRRAVGMGAVRPLLTTDQFNINPWVGYEPMRKAFNQLTTTTDTYQVIMTIGYFEVANPNGTLGGDPAFDVTARAILRREAYNVVPGDLRQQFTAMIDRSNLAKPVGAVDGTTGVPWFTELVQDAIENTAQDNNTPMGRRRYYLRFKATGGSATGINVSYETAGTTLVAGNRIRLGSGPNAETVTIRTIGARIQSAPAIIDLPAYDADTGLGTITIEYDSDPMTPPNGPQFAHIPGEAVTGGFVPGHPGRVSFDLNGPEFRGIVRFFSRLTP